MPSGTIEDDFEEALIKEAETTGDLASPKTSLVFLKTSKGKSNKQSSRCDKYTTYSFQMNIMRTLLT